MTVEAGRPNLTLTAVRGLRVGQYTDLSGGTGCTVVLCEQGAVAAVDVRGAAPATRETDLLRPENTVQEVHAILLSGGSAFGLAAADGVVQFLERKGAGFRTSAGPVPIVPAAALFDLGLGDAASRPGPADGFAACQAADEGPVVEGTVGAGTGATVGHLRGRAGASKGGLGSACRRIDERVTVGALVAVNAFGDVVDPHSGRVVAGTRRAAGGYLEPAEVIEILATRRAFGENTTLAVVATDASLSRPGLLRMAQMAHDGLARAIRPAHTGFDGDLVFALATGSESELDATLAGAVAAEVLAEAIVRAVLAARGLHGVPAVRELEQS